MKKLVSLYETLLLVWLALSTMPTEVGAHNHNEYRTDLLQLIAEKIGLRPQLDTLGVGNHYSFATFNSYPITIIVEDGRVVHIGCTIFTPLQREGFGSVVCDFIERYCLELIIPTKPEFTTELRMQLDGVKSQHKHLNPQRLKGLCNDTTLIVHIQSTPRGYSIEWRRAEEWIEAIYFPMEYDLLFGTDMDERERRLSEEIKRHVNKQNTDSIPEKRMLVKAWQDNYYTHQSGSYLLPTLKADHYFEMDKHGQLIPIYNNVYPIESLANLFTSNLIDNDFTIDLCLKKYGFKTDTISVPLKQWIDYCRETGCKPYFGIIQLDNEKASCEVIMQNANMGYNHIMRFIFPLNMMDKRNGHIMSRLNSYVNSSRIKNLFEDNNQQKNE